MKVKAILGNRAISYRKSNIITYMLFLFVPLTLLLVFSIFPAVKLFKQSFMVDWNGLPTDDIKYGFGNYINLFQDTQTWRTLANNLAHLIMMIIQLMMAFYLAVVLYTKIKIKNVFKSNIFLPYILNGVAVAYMFNYMYSFQSSPINELIRSIGLGEYAIHFLSNNYSINFALAFIGLWRFLGGNMVIFYGALQSIPEQLFDATKIDGANFFQNVRYIIIPNMKRTFEIMLFLGFNGALKAYFEPYIITQGGPAGRSATFVTSTVDIAFVYHNFGKASAMGIMLLLMIVVIILLQRTIFKGEN